MGGNKQAAAATVLAALALCAVLAAHAVVVDAAACNPSALSPCASALFGGAVTNGCCAALRVQQPCLCQYKRNPAYRGYVNGPAAQSVTAACGIPRMKC